MAAPDGYRELVESQTPALFRRALLLARDWYLAEDLVQETAVTTLMKWRQVRKGTGGWYTVRRRTADAGVGQGADD